MPILIILLFLFSFSTAKDTSDCECIKNAISTIKQHEKQIREKIYYREIPKGTYNVLQSDMNKLARMIDTLVQSKSSECKKELAIEFLYSIKTFGRFLNDTHILCDTISIKFLSSLLSCSDQEIFINAEQKLAKYTGFDALRSQSEHIKANIRKSSLDKSSYAYDILSILNLNKAEVDSIVSAKLQIWNKAYTGDSQWIDSLIKLYKEEKDLGSKGLFAYYLISTGRERGFKAVLEDFPKPLYRIAYENSPYACTSSVVINGIIAGLPRYYPHDTLFTKELWRVEMSDFRSEKGKELLSKYWIKLEAWFWEHYKIEIGKKPLYSNMFRDCYHSGFRPPNFPKKKAK